jgi:coproporphyrinogen III oxidase
MSDDIHPSGAAPWFRKLQDAICGALEGLDGKARFLEDRWEREGGGGGITRVISGGDLLEKGGVNFSEVHGTMSEAFASQVPGSGRDFRATGVSIVLHPQSPMVPGVHANVRMIQKGDAVWVGGGADMTPYYPREHDAVHFHQTWKGACDGFDPTWYPRFKSWCDAYFYLPNRDEMRGVGGIFFDYVGLGADQVPESSRRRNPLVLPDAVPKETAWLFVQEIGRKILEAWVPIAEARRNEQWGEREREFQLYRRGRYAEFNLLYDRGTRFGLETGGRTESILMSMPPLVRWTYDFTPEPGSRESQLAAFLTPRDWVGVEGE